MAGTFAYAPDLWLAMAFPGRCSRQRRLVPGALSLVVASPLGTLELPQTTVWRVFLALTLRTASKRFQALFRRTIPSAVTCFALERVNHGHGLTHRKQHNLWLLPPLVRFLVVTDDFCSHPPQGRNK